MNRSWDIFRNVNEYVRFSDTKAGVVLAFAGGSAAFLSSKVDVFHAVIAAHASDLWGFGLYAAVCCYTVTLIATVVFAFRSIWPSLGSGDGRSVIYFKHICEDYKSDHKLYAKTLGALDDAAFEEELAHQICINASIATRKYELVSKAIVALAWAGGSWAVIVFLILLVGVASPVR